MTSRFFTLNENFLLEYMYDEFETNTSINGLRLIKNDVDGSNYLFVDDGLFGTYSNILDKAYARIDTLTLNSMYLNQDLLVPYNDFSNDLTNTIDTPIDFGGNDYIVKYDIVRIHFKSGYDFHDNDGFYINSYLQTNGSYAANILTHTYLKSDTYKQFSEIPLIIGEVSYDSYIDLAIPSLNFLYEQQNVFPSDTTKLWYQLSNGNGFSLNSNIGFFFGVIDNITLVPTTVVGTTVVDYVRFSFEQVESFVVPPTDVYEKIIPEIKEADDGEYFVYQTFYGTNSIGSYINLLNSQTNGNWSLIHEIQQFEQVGVSNINTNNTMTIQTSGYDEPLTYRPIVQNSSAVAYILVYTVRLYNQITGEQILKTSQFISTNVRKYGKKMLKINLGTTPVINKIYNQIQRLNPSFQSSQQSPLLSEKIVNNFYQERRISISFDVGNNISQSTTENTVYLQNEAIITINETSSLIKFTIYDAVNGQNQNKNLVGIGTLKLIFKADDGSDIVCNRITDNDFDESFGEVLFRITDENSTQILQSSKKNFYILLNNDNIKSVLYTGNWISVSERSTNTLNAIVLQKNKLIEQLNNEISTLNDEISSLNKQLAAKDETIQQVSKITNDKFKNNDKALIDELSNRKNTSKQILNRDNVVSLKNTNITKFS